MKQEQKYTHVPSEILEGHTNTAHHNTRAQQEARRELYSVIKFALLGATAYACTAIGYLVALMVLQPY